jgi:AcrR family transcriptional regulator
MYRIRLRIDEGVPVSEAKDGVRTARRDATRGRVLDAAMEVFAERGVFGGSVEDICDRAGFTRGAFYSNFADKADVLEALIAREHARLLAELDASAASAAVAGQGGAAALESLLPAIVDRILAAVPGDRLLSLVQTELEIHAIRQPGSSASFRDADTRFRARIAEFIERGMALQGRELLVPPAFIADSAVAIVARSVRRALLAGGNADPDEMARAVLPGFLLGVSRPLAG